MRDGGNESVLLGRDVESAALRDSVARAARGDGHAVVVEGEAGIGKSALARLVADDAGRQGLDVLTCRGDVMGSGRPFGPLLTGLRLEQREDDATAAVRGLLDTTRNTASVLSAVTSERRHATAEALAGLVVTAAQDTPTLLVAEDLHWIDPSSALTLAAIARRTPGVPLLVVVTTRPPTTEPDGRDLHRLIAAGGSRLTLGPLNAAALDHLVIAAVGKPPGPALRRLLAGTQGNPLFALELVRGLAADGLLDDDGQTVDCSGDALPVSFAEHVLATVGHLDHEARGVLRLGAMLGGSFTMSDLASVSGRGVAALIEPVQAVLRAGLLGEDEDRLTFRHELVQAVIYDALPEPVRAGVHRQIATTLAGTSAPAVTVAEHVALGSQPGDTEAITWLQRGAAEVLVSAPERALGLLERACELAPAGMPQRPHLDTDRLEALGLCGRLTDVEELSAHLLHDLSEPELRARVRQLRAAALLLLNRGGEAGEELLALAAGHDGPEAVRALAEAAICFLAAGDAPRAEAAAGRARNLDGGPGSGIGHGLALAVLSRQASTLLDFDGALRLAQEAITTVEGDGSPDAHMYQPLFFSGLCLHDLDRLDDTLADVTAGRALAEAHGWGVSGGPYCALAAFTHLRAGRLADAAREAEEGVALGERLGSRLATPWCHALTALVALHRDDIPAAQAAATAGEQLLAEGPSLLGLDLLVLASALVQEANGEVAQACDSLHGAWSFFTQAGFGNMAGAIAPDVVRLAVRAERTAQAEDVCASLAAGARRLGLSSWHGAAAEAHGLLTNDPELLLAAVDHFAASPRVLARARAAEHAGVALCEHGDRDRGRQLLRQALEQFESCGAQRDRRRVAVALRAAGGRTRTSRTPPAASGWDALSTAELKVAELVAAGLPNAEVAARLFVSRRTVETHLYRIYGKLGVRSRVELAVLAGQPSG